MRARGLAFLTLVVLAAAAPPSAAALLTYHFSGQFSSTFGAAPAGLVGSPFAGTFTYDPLAGTSSAGADFAVYTTGSASVSITSVAGSGAIDAGAGNMGSRWDSLVSTATGGTHTLFIAKGRRELYKLMDAYLDGIRIAQQIKEGARHE